MTGQRRELTNIKDSLCAWNMRVKDIIKPQGGSHSPGEADLESEIPGGLRNAFTEPYPEEGVLNSA